MSPGSYNCYANYLDYRNNKIYRAPMIGEFARMHHKLGEGGHWC
jgi:hypothetical protein